MTLYYSGKLTFKGQIHYTNPLFDFIEQQFTDDYKKIENKNSLTLKFTSACCSSRNENDFQKITNKARQIGHPMTYGNIEYSGDYDGKFIYDPISDKWTSDYPVYMSDMPITTLQRMLSEKTENKQILIPNSPYETVPIATNDKTIGFCDNQDIMCISIEMLTKIVHEEPVAENIKTLYLFADRRERAIMDTLFIQMCGKTLGQIIRYNHNL